MAEFRSVKVEMWAQDEWFMDLPIDAKLLWLYLFTNAHASVAGIYKLPLRTIAFETGVDLERVQGLLQIFAQQGKAKHADGILWVVKMREHQASKSPKVLKRIADDLAIIPDTPLKREYLQKYGTDTVLIGYPELRSDTETDTETATDTDTETERETETSVASPPTPLAAGDLHATNGKSARFVDPSVFLSQIGYKNPDSLLREADETLLAKWIFYYQCLTPAQRQAVKSWPALINDRIHSNTPPRLNGEQSARFYQEWGNHDDRH